MSKKPKTRDAEELAYKAFQLMDKNCITQLVVVENKEFKGVVHLHDILREGVV